MSGIYEIGRTVINFITGNDQPVGLAGCTSAGLEDSCVASDYAPGAGDPYVDPASQNESGTVTFGEPVTFVLPSAEKCNGDTSGLSVTFSLGSIIDAPMTRNADGSYSITIEAFNWGGAAAFTITDLEHDSSITKSIYSLPAVIPASGTDPYDVCDEYPSPEVLATGITTTPHYSEAQINQEMLFSIPLSLAEACDDTTAADYTGDPTNNPFQGVFIVENAERLAQINYETGGGIFYTTHSFLEQGNQTVRFYVIDTLRPDAGHSNIINLNDFWVSDPAGVDQPPAAIAAPFAAEVGESIEFISPSADELLYSYSWNFVDGSPIEPGASVTHAFSSPGTYQVQLTVASLTSPEVYSVVTHNVTVVPPGVDIPALSMTMVDAAEEDTLVSMSVVAPDPANYTYSWNLGNGDPIAFGTDVSASYAEPGTYTVILYATSIADPGTSFSVSRILTVVGHGNPVPNLELSPASMGPAPLTVNFDATGSYATAGNLNPGDIISYTFDFGDDTPPVINSAGTASHLYSNAGAFTVAVTVEDANNQTSTITATVNTW